MRTTGPCGCSVTNSLELVRVQEALLAACSRVREAEAELGQRRGEQQRLAEELTKHQESIRQLRDERLSLQEDNNRLQHTVTLLQQQCEEHRLLLQALRMELHVYESLPGPTTEPRAGCFPSPPVRDVGTSLTASFSSPRSDTLMPQHSVEPCRASPPEKKSKGPAGAHVVGHLDTYRSLEQRILEGKALAHELTCLTRPALGLSSTGKEVPGCIGAGHLWGSASTLHRVLEECASLLTTFWSTVLPVGPAQHQGKEQALQSEITALRAQLSKREDALHNTAKQLHSMAQLKDSMEQFIVSQLTRTHNVLHKARTNLEVKAQQALPVA